MNNQTRQRLPKIDLNEYKTVDTATMAMGCFWGPDALFGVQPGVIRTRVGYAGGHTINPTYHQIGDHIETIQIEYDPNVISYQQLLQLFWQNHDPNRSPYKRQYTSALFFQNEPQQQLIQESKQQYSSELQMDVKTETLSLDQFYLAENYHQKYHLQQIPQIIAHFKTIYPNFQDIINSTAAARINGYVGGYGSSEELAKEICEFNLPEHICTILRQLVN